VTRAQILLVGDGASHRFWIVTALSTALLLATYGEADVVQTSALLSVIFVGPLLYGMYGYVLAHGVHGLLQRAAIVPRQALDVDAERGFIEVIDADISQHLAVSSEVAAQVRRGSLVPTLRDDHGALYHPASLRYCRVSDDGRLVARVSALTWLLMSGYIATLMMYATSC
jgi:hypothetical protein